jgi:hypothetical protein
MSRRSFLGAFSSNALQEARQIEEELFNQHGQTDVSDSMLIIHVVNHPNLRRKLIWQRIIKKREN